MGFKCLPQIMGLTRQSAAAAMKKDNRGSIKSIIEEFLETRYSKSEVLDRARSKLNEYFRYNDFNANMSASEIVSEIEFEVARHRTKVKTKNGTSERAIRKDAVVGWAVIINPPDEIKKDWTPEQNEQFYKDSMEYMAQLHEMFRKDNYICGAVHWDEGNPDLIAEGYDLSHYHCAGYSKDENGEFTCGNEIDFKMKDRINREYAAFMRAKGWDVDDPETRYDKTDKTPKKSMTANEYRHFKRAEKFEKQAKDLDNEVYYLKDKLKESEAERINAERDEKSAKESLKKVKDKNAELVGKYNGLVNKYNKKNEENKQLKADKVVADTEIAQLKTDLETEKNKPAEIKTIEKPVYKDNPEQAEKIRQLEDQVKQFTEDLRNAQANSITAAELEEIRELKKFINDNMAPSKRSIRGFIEYYKTVESQNMKYINENIRLEDENEKLKKQIEKYKILNNLGLDDIQQPSGFENDGL